MERRIAAILAADMAGFSRLVEADEAGVITRQKRYFTDVIEPAIQAANGRIVKLTGDGLIAEFPSVVDAVRSAVGVQNKMKALEEDQAEDRRIRYRIAVNLGDVIFDEDEIYGDGVNIAARLEALAAPGGVVISGEAYDHLKAKVDVDYRELGEQILKNITTPVRVYEIVAEGVEISAATPRPAAQPMKRSPLRIIAAAAVLLVLVAGGVWWTKQQPDVTPLDTARLKFDLPNKPSIAVTPFASLDSGRERNVLADGLTIDIIAELSRSSNLMVIASESMRTYTDIDKTPTQIAEELGVRYVLDGGLQQIGDDIQINVRLVDVLSGHIIWANTHKGRAADFFEMQDIISKDILGVIVSEYGLVAQNEVVRAKKLRATDLTAYQLVLLSANTRAKFSRENNQEALRLAKRAVEIDPEFSLAHVEVALTYYVEALNGWTDDFGASADKAKASAQKALQLDTDSAKAHAVLGAIQVFLFGLAKEGGASLERALILQPNNPDVIVLHGSAMADKGRADEGAEIALLALRLNPRHPNWYYSLVQWPLVVAGRHEEALNMYEQDIHPIKNSYLYAIISLVALGRDDDAAAVAEAFLIEYPDFSSSAEASSTSNAPQLSEFMEMAEKSWLAAGLPE